MTRRSAALSKTCSIRDPRAEAPKQLTGRQREVLQMLAEGRSMKEIAYVPRGGSPTVRYGFTSIRSWRS